MGSRGQLFSGDLAVAMFVFLISLATAIFVWDDVARNINQSERLRDLENLAASVAESLVRNKGSPADWRPYNVISPGLADSDRLLNKDKVIAFTELMDEQSSAYYRNRHLLGIGNYNFYLNITDENGQTISVDGRKAYTGLRPTGVGDTITTSRTAVLDEKIVTLTVTLWS